MTDRGWQPIDTAPRDGTVIYLTAIEDSGELFEVHPMRWCHIQRNGFFPGVIGMWTAPGERGYTWQEGEHGPTHWKPITDEVQDVIERVKREPMAKGLRKDVIELLEKLTQPPKD